MGNDQLFKKKREASQKFISAGERKHLSRFKKALIICEDSKSSPSYFKALCRHLKISRHITILPKKDGSAPSTIVKLGHRYLCKNHSEFDYCFFVFDRDTHETYDEAIQSIEDLSKRPEYQDIEFRAITSVPCFELWLMLHLKCATTPYGKTAQSAQQLIKDLKQEYIFANYDKSDCSYFDDIIDEMDTAITNSKKLIADGKNSHSSQHHIDPSTLIHELVEILQEIKESYQR